jgi:hypothetical protein
MAHLLAPEDPDPQLPVFFNVDGAVGAPPAENLPEDVLLVQFMLKDFGTKMGYKSFALLDVTGVIDEKTIEAIGQFQRGIRKLGHSQIVDKRISPARRHEYQYRQGSFWTIVDLNNQFQNFYVDIWPRIDKVPGCPEELKQMVIRQVAGTTSTELQDLGLVPSG